MKTKTFDNDAAAARKFRAAMLKHHEMVSPVMTRRGSRNGYPITVYVVQFK